MLAACQTSSQSSTAHSGSFRFIALRLVSAVIEVVARQRAADGLRVLLKEHAQVAGERLPHLAAREEGDVAGRDGLLRDGGGHDFILADQLGGLVRRSRSQNPTEAA